MFQILVVEDDKDLNRTVCAFLNASGYKATGCLSAGEAYESYSPWSASLASKNKRPM